MNYKIEEKNINLNGEEKTVYIVMNEHGIDLVKFTTLKQAEKFIKNMESGGISQMSNRIKYSKK